VRVEGAPRFGPELSHRFLPRQPRTVRAVRRERVVDVGDRHDARAERNQLSAQPVRVAAAVVALVVMPDD